MQRPSTRFHRPPPRPLRRAATALLGALLIVGGVRATDTAAVPTKETTAATEAPTPTDKLTRPPLVRKQKNAQYPFHLRAKGIAGKATVEFIVTKKGDVVDARVVEATHPEFGIAAVYAIEYWKFEPAVKDGKVMYCRMQQSFDFAMK